MRYKVFGDRTGLKVSEFALGTGMLGKAYGYGTEPDEALKILEGYAEAEMCIRDSPIPCFSLFPFLPPEWELSLSITRGVPN